MTELTLHDIEFSDLELQGGGTGGSGEDIIQLNPKKNAEEYEDEEEDADGDFDNSDDESYQGRGSKYADNQEDGDDDGDDGDDDDDDNDDDDDDDDDNHDDDDDHHDDGDDRDDNIELGQVGSDDDEMGDVQEGDDELSEDDAADIDNFKKFNQQLKMSYVADTHPEAESDNHDEVHAFATVVRDANGVIIDPLHKTIPILTKYEKTRILGMRTKQLNDGAEPYIKLPTTSVPIIDGYVIAQRELEEKKLPFIIRRPLPNGGTEYWYLQDLEIL